MAQGRADMGTCLPAARLLEGRHSQRWQYHLPGPAAACFRGHMPPLTALGQAGASPGHASPALSRPSVPHGHAEPAPVKGVGEGPKLYDDIDGVELQLVWASGRPNAHPVRETAQPMAGTAPLTFEVGSFHDDGHLDGRV